MTDCLFCKIARKEIPAKLLFEDERLLAFHDISPQAPQHVLIIPKEHLTSLDDLRAEHQPLAAELLMAAPRVARELGLSHGYRTVVNTGAHGGQSVFHLHVHVLGGRTMGWPPG